MIAGREGVCIPEGNGGGTVGLVNNSVGLGPGGIGGGFRGATGAVAGVFSTGGEGDVSPLSLAELFPMIWS